LYRLLALDNEDARKNKDAGCEDERREGRGDEVRQGGERSGRIGMEKTKPRKKGERRQG
jgi:hypothetical protein